MENNADAEVIATLLRVHPAAARMAAKNQNLVQIFPFRACLGVRLFTRTAFKFESVTLCSLVYTVHVCSLWRKVAVSHCI